MNYTQRLTMGCRGAADMKTSAVNKYRVVQRWGPCKGRQATLISEHATVAEAFAAIDRLTAQ